MVLLDVWLLSRIYIGIYVDSNLFFDDWCCSKLLKRNQSTFYNFPKSHRQHTSFLECQGSTSNCSEKSCLIYLESCQKKFWESRAKIQIFPPAFFSTFWKKKKNLLCKSVIEFICETHYSRGGTGRIALCQHWLCFIEWRQADLLRSSAQIPLDFVNILLLNLPSHG